MVGSKADVYFKIKDAPSLSMTSKKVDLAFNVSYLTGFIGRMDKGAASAVSRLFKYLDSVGQIKSIGLPEQMDEYPFSQGKSAIVIRSAALNVPGRCAILNGMLPTPRSAGEQKFLKSLLKEASNETFQLIDLELENGQIIYEGNNYVLSPGVTNIRGTEDFLANASNPMDFLDFLKNEKTKMNLLDFSSDSELGRLGQLAREKKTEVIDQICFIPRPHSDYVFTNTETLQAFKEKINYEISVLKNSLTTYVKLLDEKHFVPKNESEFENAKRPMPSWFPILRVVIHAMSNYDLAFQDHDIQFIYEKLRDVISMVSDSILMLEKGFLVLDEYTCSVPEAEKTTLSCLTPDNSKKWTKTTFYPLTIGHYRLSFSSVFHSEDLAWTGCLYPLHENVFSVLSAECCELLSQNSGESLNYCPIEYASNVSPVLLIDRVIQPLSTIKESYTQCSSNSPATKLTESESLLTDCSISLVSTDNQIFDILSKKFTAPALKKEFRKGRLTIVLTTSDVWSIVIYSIVGLCASVLLWLIVRVIIECKMQRIENSTTRTILSYFFCLRKWYNLMNNEENCQAREPERELKPILKQSKTQLSSSTELLPRGSRSKSPGPGYNLTNVPAECHSLIYNPKTGQVFKV